MCFSQIRLGSDAEHALERINEQDTDKSGCTHIRELARNIWRIDIDQVAHMNDILSP